MTPQSDHGFQYYMGTSYKEIDNFLQHGSMAESPSSMHVFNVSKSVFSVQLNAKSPTSYNTNDAISIVINPMYQYQMT